jgi:hypothetical protein
VKWFWKDVLAPGTFVLRDGRKVTFTRADCKQAFANLKGMLDAKRNVPFCWGHQPVEPYDPFDRLADEIRNTIGHPTDARMDGDRVLALLPAPDEKTASTLEAVKWCSPEVRRDYRDSKGKLWPGAVITHIAATANPVQLDQRPYQPVALSQDRLWLSLDSMEPPMADEKDDKPGKGDDKEGGGAGGDIALICEALREAGWTIPDEVQDATGLVIAIKAGQGGETAELPAEDDPVVTDDNAFPVAMSYDAVKNPAAAELLKHKRAGLIARAKKINRADLAKKLETAQLSLDNKFNVQGGKELWELEIREDEAKKAGFKRPAAQLSQDDLQEVPLPGGPADEDQEARELARQTAARKNGTAKKGA